MPEVSVLLPFFNAQESLGDAINSIVNQTYPGWELILIDNNSTDKSRDIAQEWTQKDTRIKLIDEKLQGIAWALNKGITLAKGQYIARMDADDWSFPYRLKKQIDFLESNPDIEVASCQTVFRSNLEQHEGFKIYVDWQNNIVSPEDHFLNQFIESPIAHPTVVFNKNLINKHGYYSTKENIPEDYELWLRWMKSGVRFGKIPEKLLVWNDSLDRLSRTSPSYSKESFIGTKLAYLAEWLKENVSTSLPIVACGTSSECLKKVEFLESLGIEIMGLTDIKQKKLVDREFFDVKTISRPGNYFILNLISQRGANIKIREFLNSNGYQEGINFILAG